MKHILKFLVQCFIIVFILYPIIIGRFLWTFKWNDNYGRLNVTELFSKSWKQMKWNIQGKRWSTF
jgi:hypothetical protein